MASDNDTADDEDELVDQLVKNAQRPTEMQGDSSRMVEGRPRAGDPRRPQPSYRAIDREEVEPGIPIDLFVHRRIGGARLERELELASQAVVEALGKRRRIWFAYEELQARITDRRQAVYVDLGVEHGIAAARATVLPGRRGKCERPGAAGGPRADAQAPRLLESLPPWLLKSATRID